MKKDRKYKKYKRLTIYQKELIYKMYEEKMELRKIARVIGVTLRAIQYHIQKKIAEYKNLYKDFVELFNNSKLLLSYMVIDEMYSFIQKKSNKCYIWARLIHSQE